MTRQFRRTEEQFRASVRGLNVSPDYEPAEPPPAPESPAAESPPPAHRSVEAPRAPAVKTVRARSDAAKSPKPGRIRRMRGTSSPSVERIVVPKSGEQAPTEPSRTRLGDEVARRLGESTRMGDELSRRLSEPPDIPAYVSTGRFQTVSDEETRAMEAVQPEAPADIPTGEMVAIQNALSAPEASEAPEASPEPAAEAPGAPAAEPEPDETVAVAVNNGVKIYGTGANAVRAIDGVTHEFPRGRFTAIMGPSGSGKSTLLHCLAALDDLSTGNVFIGRVNVSALDEKGKTQMRRDKVGFIFQSFNLVPTLTALENITLPMELAKREPDHKWVNYLVQTVGLADRLDHLPSELSGGQQQRVAAARALAAKPEIVFADEPTGNLDSRRSIEILQFLRAAVDEFGQTIVMVTHDPVAASFADSVVFLADGRIVTEMDGPTVDSVLDQIKVLEAAEG